MIQLLYAADGLPPGDYNLDPDVEARLICSGLARAVSGQIIGPSASQLFALARGRVQTALGKPSAAAIGGRMFVSVTGLALSGPVALQGWYCSVAAGTMTLYDSLTATGTAIETLTPLLAGGTSYGAIPRFFTTGVYVVLSDPTARIELYY
jgi:hypothetical protein